MLNSFCDPSYAVKARHVIRAYLAIDCTGSIPGSSTKIKRAIGLLVGAVLSCTAAMAQSENPYNGEWTATWARTKGLVKEQNKAVVVILDNGGTFRNHKASSKDPCVGQKAPIAVKTATGDELVLVIQFSTALHGRKDSEVKLKRVDDKPLKGTRDADKAITLVEE